MTGSLAKNLLADTAAGTEAGATARVRYNTALAGGNVKKSLSVVAV